MSVIYGHACPDEQVLFMQARKVASKLAVLFVARDLLMASQGFVLAGPR